MLFPRRVRAARASLVLAALLATAAAPLPLVAADEPSAAVDGNADILAAVSALEYDLQLLQGGGATAPSRRQGLRTTWQDGRVRVAPRAADGDWSLSFALQRVGRTAVDGAFRGRDVSSVTSQSVAGGRLDWARDGVSEWWTNSPLGVEQSIAIAERPEGARRRPVVVESALEGISSATRTDGGGLAFTAAGGTQVLRVQGVTAVDARGAAIPAWMDFQGGVLRIGYDDRGAVYPVVLDPLFTSPDEVLSLSQNNAFFGWAVASAGDVNGDGFGDVLVGAYLLDHGQNDEGAAYVFLGKAGGIETVPAWSAESNQTGAQLGAAVAGAGDVDGDGYDDILLGAPLYNGSTASDGAVFLYLGGPTGMGPGGTPLNADWFAYGQQSAGRFGASVALGGNLDGSGLSAVVVGALKQRSAPSAPITDGAVLVWLGGGANSAAATAGSGLPTPRATANVILGGLQSQSQFGIAVAGPGDIDGNGIDDLLVGADLYDAGQSNEGRAFVFLGPLTMPASPAWTAESNQASAQLAFSVSGAGDVNCDGFADIILGAPYGEGRYPTTGVYKEGFAVVYLGGPAGPGNASGLGALGTPQNADWSAESDQSGARLGWSVSAVPPGRCGVCGGEVLVGAPYLKVSGRTAAGGAFGWESDGAGLGPDGRALINADWAVTGEDANDQAGFAVAGLLDVDGDGAGDAIVGVPYGEGGALANGGEAHVFLSDLDEKCGGCGSDQDCDDFDACTDDYCDPDTGECYTKEVDCDDEDACTDDYCLSERLMAKGLDPIGGCQHDPVDCDDKDPCTIDSCDPKTGECVYEAVDCADKDACTDDACVPSLEVAYGQVSGYDCTHVERDCDDGDPCTTDWCDENGNCQHDAVVCDDANACTDDQCVPDGPCFGCFTPGSHCEFTPVNCEDGDTCTFDACVPNDTFAFAPNLPYTCEHEAVECDDGNPCTDDTCVPQPTLVPGSLPAGCENTPIVCEDDGDACNGVETCDNGECVSMDPVICLDDGDACNGVETCVDGECVSVDPVICLDDGDPCTDDYCFEGECIHPEVSCDDGDACSMDSCSSLLKCGGGPPCVHEPLCDDDNPCTMDACFDGSCAYQAVECDDGYSCNGSETCDPGTGQCVSGDDVWDCDDGDACTDEYCGPGDAGADADGCVRDQVICPDNSDPCDGEEICDYVQGCMATNVPDCDDGDPCTDDFCGASFGFVPAPGGDGPCVHQPIDGCCDDDSDCDAYDFNGAAFGGCNPTCINNECDYTGCDTIQQGPAGDPGLSGSLGTPGARAVVTPGAAATPAATQPDGAVLVAPGRPTVRPRVHGPRVP